MNYPMNFRRQRQTEALRRLFSEVSLTSKNLVQPYFVYEELKKPEPLTSLSGQTKHTGDSLVKEVETLLKNKVSSVMLFFVPTQKAEKNFSYDFDTKTIHRLKETFGPDLNLFTDMCLCSNTVSGHCGICTDKGIIDNNSSVKELAHKSLQYAQAGSDAICPSDMMDHRVKAIRETLNANNLHQTLIMSYSTKFSSNFYGPFREAAKSAFQFGNRKTYQLDYRHTSDAIRCSLRDAEEGADSLMVKPATLYLDIIKEIKTNPQTAHLPLAAYHVSGEYQSLHLMEKAGIMSFKEGYLETLTAIRRAGADIIITYGAKDFRDFYEL